MTERGRLEELTSAYGRDLRLTSFLESVLGHVSKNARIEVLYYNNEQASLEQIDHIGFTATLEGMKVRFVRKTKDDNDFEGAGICAYVALTGESVLSPYVRFDKRYRQILRDNPTQSELAVPIKLADKVIGVLNLESDLPRAFGNEELDFIQGIAPLLAVMLEYETFKREEDFLREVLPSITALASKEEMFLAILNSVLKLVGNGALGCIMVPVEGSLDILRVAMNRGLNLTQGQQFNLKSLGVIRRACSSIRGQCFWSVEEGMEDYVALGENIRSEFVSAMKFGDRIIAVLDVESAQQVISERYGRAIGRLCDYGAALIYGLEKNSEVERKKEQETVLEAMKHEVHNATGMFGLLVRDLESRTGLKDADRNLGDAIQGRLRSMNRLVVGFLSPPRTVQMKEVVHGIQDIAQQLGVALVLEGNFDFEVMGTKVGFTWLFENLVLNTRKHGEWKESNTAWLVAPEPGLIRYWDDRQAPPSLITHLNGRTDRQGLKLIKALCGRYGWAVEVSQHPNGSIQYEFRFEPL